MVYGNQCAINMSSSLMRSGIDMKTFAGARSCETENRKAEPIWFWQVP
ncbi:type VI secretion system (T6SS) effector Tae4 (amidase) [Roseateles depolymerans]|uniref:Uncharacterized protein n=1 Tax=Roseateles depolymerans TaxID=76731 RepID=A0A0U3MVJ1_9BURK|nr:hypothetical protein RD2015_3927 [Roseateles depolymerans]REG21398.1 type VI secretion system (T6SS) effector Tae4 (amidase) [Roseateles depolymerans]